MPDASRDFDIFYGRYSAWLRSRLVRRYGSQTAEDLLQDTWARFFAYQKDVVISRPQALLLTIAANLVGDGHRRRIRDEKYETALGVRLVEAPAQADELFAKEVILSLPQPLRDVFVLSRFGGLTNAQIAEQLGIRPKTVEWRMTKALAHCAARYRL